MSFDTNDIINIIKNGDYKDIVDKIRSVASVEEKNEAKKNIPAYSTYLPISGRSHAQSNIASYNLVVYVDIDAKQLAEAGLTVEGIKEEAKNHEEVFICYTSCSGTGVHFLFRCFLSDNGALNQTKYPDGMYAVSAMSNREIVERCMKKMRETVIEFVVNTLKVNVDPIASNRVAGLIYFSYDPQLYVNWGAKYFEIDVTAEVKPILEDKPILEVETTIEERKVKKAETIKKDETKKQRKTKAGKKPAVKKSVVKPDNSHNRYKEFYPDGKDLYDKNDYENLVRNLIGEKKIVYFGNNIRVHIYRLYKNGKLSEEWIISHLQICSWDALEKRYYSHTCSTDDHSFKKRKIQGCYHWGGRENGNALGIFHTKDDPSAFIPAPTTVTEALESLTIQEVFDLVDLKSGKEKMKFYDAIKRKRQAIQPSKQTRPIKKYNNKVNNNNMKANKNENTSTIEENKLSKNLTNNTLTDNNIVTSFNNNEEQLYEDLTNNTLTDNNIVKPLNIKKTVILSTLLAPSLYSANSDVKKVEAVIAKGVIIWSDYGGWWRTMRSIASLSLEGVPEDVCVDLMRRLSALEPAKFKNEDHPRQFNEAKKYFNDTASNGNDGKIIKFGTFMRYCKIHFESKDPEFYNNLINIK